MTQQPHAPDVLVVPANTPARPRLRRRICRWLLRGLLLLLAFALLYLLAVWILGAIAVHRGYQPATTGIDIMISSNGIHTDFYLPRKTPEQDWTSFAPLQHMSGYLADSPLVLIGWGDRSFFLDTPNWEDLTVAKALKAVFLPTSSVMHVYYREGMPAPGERAVRLRLSTAEYRLFVAQIERGFRKNANGLPIMIPDRSYSESDVFYEGVGSYHLFYTCNNWASNALSAAGVTSPLWSPFDAAIFSHLPR